MGEFTIAAIAATLRARRRLRRLAASPSDASVRVVVRDSEHPDPVAACAHAAKCGGCAWCGEAAGEPPPAADCRRRRLPSPPPLPPPPPPPPPPPRTTGSAPSKGHCGTRDDRFVSVRGGQLWRNRAYRFAGANLWYAAQLGSTPEGRQRLTRELDRLHAAGLTHVRIMAASEGRPDATVPRPCEKWCNPTHGHCSWDKYPVNCACSGCGFCRSQAPELLEPKRLDAACRQGGSAQMEPPMQPRPGQYDDAVLHGLDFALAMLLKRGMTATLCLNNMWQWSGGFAVYVAWATGQAPPVMRIDAKTRTGRRTRTLRLASTR